MPAIARTHQGLVRMNNEDSLWVDDTKGIYVVADGMGGYAAGEVASQMAIEAMKQMVAENPQPSLARLFSAVNHAGEEILNATKTHPDWTGMGTTLSLLWETDRYMYAAHIGDSRIYLFRDGELRQMTEDHSLVAEFLRSGLITAEEAKVHPHRNIITRALGTEGNNEPDILALEKRIDDLWLLCTDGLYGMVEEETIQQILSGDDPEGMADALLAAALDGGGRDNVSFIICFKEGRTWKHG